MKGAGSFRAFVTLCSDANVTSFASLICLLVCQSVPPLREKISETMQTANLGAVFKKIPPDLTILLIFLDFPGLFRVNFVVFRAEFDVHFSFFHEN